MTWQLINGIVRGNTTKKQLPSIFINNNGECTSDKNEIAESYNNFFISVGELLQQEIAQGNKDPLDYIHQSEHTLNSIQNTNCDELAEEIKHMKKRRGRE